MSACFSLLSLSRSLSRSFLSLSSWSLHKHIFVSTSSLPHSLPTDESVAAPWQDTLSCFLLRGVKKVGKWVTERGAGWYMQVQKFTAYRQPLISWAPVCSPQGHRSSQGQPRSRLPLSSNTCGIVKLYNQQRNWQQHENGQGGVVMLPHSYSTSLQSCVLLVSVWVLSIFLLPQSKLKLSGD